MHKMCIETWNMVSYFVIFIYQCELLSFSLYKY